MSKELTEDERSYNYQDQLKHEDDLFGSRTPIELEDPKLILEVIDKLTVQARCNKCKSDDIAVIIKRISLNER